jgi:ribosomal protein S18 acetylase RimI-like enzyme
MITLRPMTPEEFTTFRAEGLEDYAHERARNLNHPIEEERAEATRQYDHLLPDGVGSPGQRLWSVLDGAGAVVGSLWVALKDGATHAFIYYIVINADQRGKGYGKATLDALDATLKPLGVTHIGLNVFADNPIAQRLYARQGYTITNYSMQKQI